MLTPEKIEELRGLLAKATPGPWKNHLVDDTTIVASNGFEIGTTWPGGSVYNGFVDPAEQHEINAALIVAMRNALPALLDLAPKALATLSLAGEDARPEDRAEQFIQAAVDSAPEPLRRLGEWLANKLDDDDWKTAERLLNGASVEARSLSLRVEAEKRERERLKDRIDLRMNDYLVEMREGYDDSITGFNEAWDIVRSVFADMESNNAGK